MSLSTLRYAQMNTRSESTEDGYETAVKRFNEFATLQNYPKFADLTQEHVEGKIEGVPVLHTLLSEFCSFILDYKVNGKNIKPGTQKQYLSGTHNALKKKHPRLVCNRSDLGNEMWNWLYQCQVGFTQN